MFNPKKASALFLSACLLLATAGCGNKQSTAAVSSAASQVSSAVESTASDVSAAASSAVDSSSSEAASTAEKTVSKSGAITAVPESGAVSSSPSSDPAFNKKWSANPLDKAFKTASEEADTNKKILQLYSDYADKWQNEVASAYERLMTVSGNDAALKNEQTEWVNGKADALQKLKESVASDGTGAALAVANKTMQFYRSRAQQLYFELYKYDPNFSFTDK